MKTLWQIWAEMGIDDETDESKAKCKEYIEDSLKNNRFHYRDFDDVVRPFLISLSDIVPILLIYI